MLIRNIIENLQNALLAVYNMAMFLTTPQTSLSRRLTFFCILQVSVLVRGGTPLIFQLSLGFGTVASVPTVPYRFQYRPTAG